MENVESQGTASSLPTVGSRLRQARDAAGLSRTDIATQTKIAERHLIAIEEDRFNDLAARTYAVGFSRAYARAVGIDEAEIAEQVRGQLDAEDNMHRRPLEPSFEPGDPARVPPVRMAWLAAAGVVIVVGLLLAFWGSFLSPEGRLPDLIAAKTDKPEAPQTPAPVAVATASEPAINSGPVVMTATADGVWVKVTDASGKQLLQKELALGESWTVPQDAAGPQLRTGRPDALKLTVGGKEVSPLADRPVTMSGVSLAAADVLARVSGGAGAPASPASGVAPRPVAAPVSTPTPAATGNVAPKPATSQRPTTAPPVSPRPSPTSSSQVGANPALRPVAARPSPAASSPASSIPAGETLLPVPSPSPSPKPALQPVSTVSE